PLPTPPHTQPHSLSLHDALPIWIEFFGSPSCSDSGDREAQTFLDSLDVTSDFTGAATITGTINGANVATGDVVTATARDAAGNTDRKSTRLNSSHQIISYAVFCL